MALFGRGKVTPETIMTTGATTTGRIIGIEVDETSGSGDHTVRIDDYAIEVDAPTPFVAGVRQTLDPDNLMRLGMKVTVRYIDDKAVIDWAATCGGDAGVAAILLKQPPPPGITDSTIGLSRAKKKGVPGQATITAVSVRDTMLGLKQSLVLDVTVRPEGLDAYDTEIVKGEIPFYASHLADIGNELPCWVRLERLDKVVIDWPAAAMGTPGIDAPPSAVLRDVGNVFTRSEGPGQTMGSQPAEPVDFSAGALNAHALDAPPIEGVTFETWVAVEAGLMRDRVSPSDYDAYAQQHGVTAGSWTAVSAGWNKAMMSDWRIGAAYGQAIEDARKRKK